MDPFLSILGNYEFYSWVVLPIIIFFARICDVSLGTIRIILVSRGKRNIAPILGFCEVFIWIVAIGQIVQNIHSVTAFVGYAAGFAAGNYIGMLIEDKLAMGIVIIRIIIPEKGEELVELLHKAGFGVTKFIGEGANGSVTMIITVIKRKAINNVVFIIQSINPGAFFSIEDVRSTNAGIFPIMPYNLENSLFRRKFK